MQISSLKEKLKSFPAGSLVCIHDGSRCKWYERSGRQKRYISKKNRFQAEQLAMKKYLLLMLEDAEQEKQALEGYLRYCRTGAGKAEQLLAEYPEYQELVAPYFLPKSKAASDWMNAPYQRNMKYPEQLKHRSPSGNIVRSKSEEMIDMCLYRNRIPYRYECALELGEAVFYPDFTILHPETGKLYYWEHFGLADDPAYCRQIFSKLQHYATHGIIPSINLITTYETKENPLNSENIEKIISHYFL